MVSSTSSVSFTSSTAGRASLASSGSASTALHGRLVLAPHVEALDRNALFDNELVVTVARVERGAAGHDQ